ncbi:MAG: hypothetical protein DRJ97_00555 [Thermoprotei archaeon]|nr:MAG: hypothetical protein DRJ97_00555 [Thermoprotei archaeon]
MRFKPIASAGGITLRHPYEGYVSFTSSPYTAHLAWAAVDLSTSTEFGDEALSPVEGTVDKVVEVNSGVGVYGKIDYMISIRPRGCSKLRVKIMHVRPAVKPGEEVVEGSLIGRFIRTNYFSYHHLPHMHVEVCRDSSLRPTRALPLTPLIQVGALRALREVKVRVEEVEEGYALCRVEGVEVGVVGTVNRNAALLNGQVGVRAEYLGLLGLKEATPGEKVELAGETVAYIKLRRAGGWLALPSRTSFKAWYARVQRAYMSRGEAPEPRLRVNSPATDKIRGLELLLSERHQVKLIPYLGSSLHELRGATFTLSVKLLS